MRLKKVHIRVKSVLDPHYFAPDTSWFQVLFCKFVDGLPFWQPDPKDDSVYLKAAKAFIHLNQAADPFSKVLGCPVYPLDIKSISGNAQPCL